jgi:hypothetical protein
VRYDYFRRLTLHTAVDHAWRSVLALGAAVAISFALTDLVEGRLAQDYARVRRLFTGPSLEHWLPPDRLALGENVQLPAMMAASGSGTFVRPDRSWLLTVFDASCVVSLQSVPFWNRLARETAATSIPYVLLGCGDTLSDVRQFQVLGDTRAPIYFAPCGAVEPLLKVHGGIVHYLVNGSGSVLDEWVGMPVQPTGEADMIAQVLAAAKRKSD